MSNLNLIIDHKLRLQMSEVSAETLEDIREALTIPNLEKTEAQKQKLWDWQSMPDWIILWEEEDDWLLMPRGFAGVLAPVLRQLGHTLYWDDRRKFELLEDLSVQTYDDDGKPITTHKWQQPAMEAILDGHQGIYKAPAGSGKTATILFALKALPCKSLIIVNTKDIVWQWQQRVKDFLGPDYPVGQIGDGIFEVSDYITIATAQTLHSRFNALEEEGFFEQFSFVCLDECHHAQADTYNRVLNRFTARYRVGVSATPDKTGNFKLSENVLGPIIHTTNPRDVDSLMMPKVIRVTTNFFFGFRPTKSRWQRSNYPQMIQALIADPERNELIIRNVLANEGHHQLVLSKRLEHLDTLQSMLEDAEFDDPIVKITGSESNDDRQAAKELAETQPCVLLSTLADEAMDIPRLDRLHLTFPQKNPGLITQQVGRVERTHPEKKDALIYDYADLKVGPLDNQWKVRRRQVYIPREYEIEMRRAEVAA